MALVDRLLGDPRQASGPELARGVRRGSEAHVVTCIRLLGERDEEPAVALLEGCLRDPRRGVDRAAAGALGHLGRPRSVGPLRAAWDHDRTEEGRLAQSVALVRCGADAAPVIERLYAFERRSLETSRGPRSPQATVGHPSLVDRFWMSLGPAPDTIVPRAELLAARREALEGGAVTGGERDLVQQLAVLRHPDDHDRIEARFHSAGRREEHALLISLGLNGDPRALRRLTDALFATDVDPGRGFMQRRLCSTGLGRLGLEASVKALHRGLENEALDFEGRPGAGMGVQYPVRTDILWALGEIGSPKAISTLASYLSNTTGSALGGFYLPAMDALAKFGPAALPQVRAVLAQGHEAGAANARGVIAAIEAAA